MLKYLIALSCSFSLLCAMQPQTDGNGVKAAAAAEDTVLVNEADLQISEYAGEYIRYQDGPLPVYREEVFIWLREQGRYETLIRMLKAYLHPGAQVEEVHRVNLYRLALQWANEYGCIPTLYYFAYHYLLIAPNTHEGLVFMMKLLSRVLQDIYAVGIQHRDIYQSFVDKFYTLPGAVALMNSMALWAEHPFLSHNHAADTWTGFSDVWREVEAWIDQHLETILQSSVDWLRLVEKKFSMSGYILVFNDNRGAKILCPLDADRSAKRRAVVERLKHNMRKVKIWRNFFSLPYGNVTAQPDE